MYGIWSCAACGATACATPLESSPNNPWTLSSSTRLRICWIAVSALASVSRTVTSTSRPSMPPLSLISDWAISRAPLGGLAVQRGESGENVRRPQPNHVVVAAPARAAGQRDGRTGRRPAGIVADRPASGFPNSSRYLWFGFACFLHPDLQLPLLTIIRECPPYKIQVNHMHRSVF